MRFRPSASTRHHSRCSGDPATSRHSRGPEPTCRSLKPILFALRVTKSASFARAVILLASAKSWEEAHIRSLRKRSATLVGLFWMVARQAHLRHTNGFVSQPSSIDRTRDGWWNVSWIVDLDPPIAAQPNRFPAVGLSGVRGRRSRPGTGQRNGHLIRRLRMWAPRKCIRRQYFF